MGIIPAIRRYSTGAWAQIPHQPLRVTSADVAGALRVDEVLAPHAAELAARPLYISIDKDVMPAEAAMTNWDAGHLRLEEVKAVVRTALRLADGKLAGADLTGDWSPVQTSGMLRRVLHRIEHSATTVDSNRATEINAAANAVLLEAITSSTAFSQ